MKRHRQSALIFGGFIILAVAMALLIRPRAAQTEGGSANWEFPADWFLQENDQQRTAHGELLGKTMAAMELSDWWNGRVEAADLLGKVVVVDFWATWCGPCIAEFPHNNEMFAKYHDQGFELIGVCTAEGQESFDKIVQTRQVKYPVARDPQLKTMTAWRVFWFPTYAVIDRKGKLRAIGLKAENVEQVVKKLLKE